MTGFPWPIPLRERIARLLPRAAPRRRQAAPPAPEPPPRIAAPPDAARASPGSPAPEGFGPARVIAVSTRCDYFRCDRWMASVSAGTCLERYDIASAPRPRTTRFERCKGCPVGAELLMKLGKK